MGGTYEEMSSLACGSLVASDECGIMRKRTIRCISVILTITPLPAAPSAHSHIIESSTQHIPVIEQDVQSSFFSGKAEQ
jgi:hypothetical protein